MAEKFSYKYLTDYIEKQNCKWISGVYTNSRSKLEILFTCGHSDIRDFNYFQTQEKLCRKCISRSKNRVPRNSWNIETMNLYCLENNIDYRVLDIKRVDKGYQRQLWGLVKCPNENHSAYWTWWNNFLMNYFCKQCYGDKYEIIFWNREKIEIYYSKFGLTIIDWNEWKNVDSRVYCINTDGYYVAADISNLRVYERNPKWGPNLFKGNKYAIENIKIFCKKERPDYEILSDKYLGIKNYHLFQYNGIGLKECSDKRFYATVDGFYHGKIQHPDINKTKAEMKIESFLKRHNIFYKFQYTDHHCRNSETGSKLKFDFGIFNDDGSLKFIIESDGKSHDTSVEYFGGDEGLKSIHKRDEIKNIYCADNNIYLLRINYKEDKHIESILTKELGMT